MRNGPQMPTASFTNSAKVLHVELRSLPLRLTGSLPQAALG